MKKIKCIMLALMCLLAFSGCGRKEQPKGDICQVYYISGAETKVEMHQHVMQSESFKDRLQELLDCLGELPEKLEYKVPFAMGFQVLDTRFENGKITIDVDAAYEELRPTTEVLVRAAIVRTLTQLPEIKYVEITVEGTQLYDSLGIPVGWMNAEQFINNDGSEINTYELVKVKLYFANETGDKLIPAYREKHYSTNTPLERFVVDELIVGPSGKIEGIYPSVNPNTKIVNVMTKDGICYVNLDESFQTVVNNVSTELSIYAIVNSLVELPNINKVQILINGEALSNENGVFYERNLDMVSSLNK